MDKRFIDKQEENDITSPQFIAQMIIDRIKDGNLSGVAICMLDKDGGNQMYQWHDNNKLSSRALASCTHQLSLFMECTQFEDDRDANSVLIQYITNQL